MKRIFVFFNLNRVIFTFSITVFIWSLWNRYINVDDAWLAEYSYYLNKLGYVKSEGMRGFYGAENQLFAYHKLFHIEGAWFIRLFGFNPYVLKSLSLVYLIGSLPILSSLYKKYSISKNSFLLLLAMLFSFYHTMDLGFMFRPELHLMFWSLLSFYFLDKYFDVVETSNSMTSANSKAKAKAKASLETYLNSKHIKYIVVLLPLVLSAFFTGVGIASHLNGMAFTGAAILLLWLKRKWLHGFIYGIISTWGLVFYVLYDVRSINDFKQLYLQLTNWRDVASGQYGVLQWIIRPFNEYLRYLHSPPEIIYSLMLLLLLIPARKFAIKSTKPVLVYLGLLSLCISEITHNQTSKYLIYAMPFFLLLATWSFEHLIEIGRKKLAWITIIIFIASSLIYDISKFKNKEIAAPEYAKVSEFLPKNAKVLAPQYLFFSGIDKLQIQTFSTYRDKADNGILKYTAESLFEEAQKFDIDFVVVNKGVQEDFNIVQNTYGVYHIMKSQPSTMFSIFERDKTYP